MISLLRPALPAARLRVLRRSFALAAIVLPACTALAVADGPDLTGAASSSLLTWVPPTTITEDTAAKLNVSGEVNGQVTGHVALLAPTTPCPRSPLYPQQLVTGTTLAVTPTTAPTTPVVPPTGTTPTTPTTPLGGTIKADLSVTQADSGSYRMCGWVVGRPASSEASTVSTFDQAVTVANKVATIDVQVPVAVRSGDYFTAQLTGTTPGSGRRALVMAEPNQGQQCSDLRKLPNGKRKLQSVIGLATGTFSKTSRLRFTTKTAGSYLLCAQVVESTDRNPEGIASKLITITESAKCVGTQAAISQRQRDLQTIRTRRDGAKSRLAAAQSQVGPLQKTFSKQKRASDRRVAKARRAVARAKSPAARKRAKRHLASVRRTEAKYLKRVGKSYRQASAKVALEQRNYNQYRTGANLLMDTIARMKKDTKKYCATPTK